MFRKNIKIFLDDNAEIKIGERYFFNNDCSINTFRSLNIYCFDSVITVL